MLSSNLSLNVKENIVMNPARVEQSSRPLETYKAPNSHWVRIVDYDLNLLFRALVPKMVQVNPQGSTKDSTGVGNAKFDS